MLRCVRCVYALCCVVNALCTLCVVLCMLSVRSVYTLCMPYAVLCTLWGGGKLLCAQGGGGSLDPLSRTPPLLGSRDGAIKKVIDGGK